jgi:hypothetical protein
MTSSAAPGRHGIAWGMLMSMMLWCFATTTLRGAIISEIVIESLADVQPAYPHYVEIQGGVRDQPFSLIVAERLDNLLKIRQVVPIDWATARVPNAIVISEGDWPEPVIPDVWMQSVDELNLRPTDGVARWVMLWDSSYLARAGLLLDIEGDWRGHVIDAVGYARSDEPVATTILGEPLVQLNEQANAMCRILQKDGRMGRWVSGAVDVHWRVAGYPVTPGQINPQFIPEPIGGFVMGSMLIVALARPGRIGASQSNR